MSNETPIPLDTSIYKNVQKPPDPLQSLSQTMQLAKQANAIKSQTNSSSGSSSYPGSPSDTLQRLGAGTPYGG